MDALGPGRLRLHACMGLTRRRRPCRSVLKFKDEINFNLSAYMVVLDKPLGLTLAPDPVTGQVRPQQTPQQAPPSQLEPR